MGLAMDICDQFTWPVVDCKEFWVALFIGRAITDGSYGLLSNPTTLAWTEVPRGCASVFLQKAMMQ